MPPPPDGPTDAGSAKPPGKKPNTGDNVKPRISMLATAIAAIAAAPVSAQTQGVSKNEIVIGTIQDLSGPVAGMGKPGRNGM